MILDIVVRPASRSWCCRSPDWYREAWFRHLREEVAWSEERIHAWVQREVRTSGIPVPVPPPPRHSARYVACRACGEHVAAWDTGALTCPGCGARSHGECAADGCDMCDK